MKDDNSTGIPGFEKALKVYIDKRSEADEALAVSCNRLKNFQEQKEKCQASLNDAVRESVEGKADVEVANEAKRNLDSICLLIDELEKNTIPSKGAELKQAEKQLISNLELLLSPLKLEHLKRMNIGIKVALDEGVGYIRYVEDLIKKLELQDVIPWYEKERLYSIVPDVGKCLSDAIKELMRLK